MDTTHAESRAAGHGTTRKVPSFVDKTYKSRCVTSIPRENDRWWTEVPSTYQTKYGLWFMLTANGARELSATVASYAAPKSGQGSLPSARAYHLIDENTVKACMEAIQDRYSREFAKLDEECFTAYKPVTGSAASAHFVEDVEGTKPNTLNLIFIPPPSGTHRGYISHASN